MFGIFVFEFNRLIITYIGDNSFNTIDKDKVKEFLSEIGSEEIYPHIRFDPFKVERIVPGVYVFSNTGKSYYIGSTGGGLFEPKTGEIVLSPGIINFFKLDWKNILIEEILHKQTVFLIPWIFILAGPALLCCPILCFMKKMDIRLIDKSAYLLSSLIICYYLFELIGIVGSLIRFPSLSSFIIGFLQLSIAAIIFSFYGCYTTIAIKKLKARQSDSTLE